MINFWISWQDENGNLRWINSGTVSCKNSVGPREGLTAAAGSRVKAERLAAELTNVMTKALLSMPPLKGFPQHWEFRG